MTDSIGQVLLPLFPFPNKIRIKNKPSVDWSSHPSYKYFSCIFLMSFKIEEYFMVCFFFPLLSFSSAVHHKTDYRIFFLYWFMSYRYSQKPRQKIFLNVKNMENIRREWNWKGKILREVHVINKSVKRSYHSLGITICFKQHKVSLQVEYNRECSGTFFNMSAL